MQTQLMEQFFKQYQNNPLFARAQQMANGKSEDEIKMIAMNICKEKGIDIEQMMQQFQTLFNQKK